MELPLKEKKTKAKTTKKIKEEVSTEEVVSTILKEEKEEPVVVLNVHDHEEEEKMAKKRGRKPKGGKIVQQLHDLSPPPDERQNIILHLKCSMKDLQPCHDKIHSYNNHDLNYEIVEAPKAEATHSGGIDGNSNGCSHQTNKKLKQLEQHLHLNHPINSRSACFWDTCEFDNPPVYIPKYFIQSSYHVYGCFCSPECAAAYLMNEPIDNSTKFERYHLLNHLYSKSSSCNIKPAPIPQYMLEKYFGNLTIQEYRSLFKTDRLFLIVDKPLTRILPELHEDNEDLILNNKIIPSNNYNLKTARKKNKNSVISETFNVNATTSTTASAIA